MTIFETMTRRLVLTFAGAVLALAGYAQAEQQEGEQQQQAFDRGRDDQQHRPGEPGPAGQEKDHRDPRARACAKETGEDVLQGRIRRHERFKNMIRQHAA